MPKVGTAETVPAVLLDPALNSVYKCILLSLTSVHNFMEKFVMESTTWSLFNNLILADVLLYK